MIVPVKKATLVVLREDRDAVTAALQRCGEFMPLPVGDDPSPVSVERAPDALRAEQALRLIRPYCAKRGMFAQRPEVPADVLLRRDSESEHILACIESAAAEADAATVRESELRVKIEETEPWRELTVSVDSLRSTGYTGVYTGYIAPGSAAALEETVSAAGGAAEILDTGPHGTAVVVYTYRPDEEELLSSLGQLGFTQMSPPCGGIPAEALEELKRELSETLEKRANALERLASLADSRDRLELYSDQAETEHEREEAPCAETSQTVYLQGWVRSDRTERLEKAVARAVECYMLTFADPCEDDDPPTVTKNNGFITPFETITDMFSRPGSKELDPNPVMGPWYWLIFGLMMGDAGYGVMMLIGIWLFRMLKKPRGDFGKLVNVLLFSSVTTIFWGVMFGSYFGETWHPLIFAPLDNPMGMLIFCMVIGVLHIFTGMVMKMTADIKAGHPWDAVFDQLSWMVLITGLGLLFLPGAGTVGAVMACLGALVILLTAGRAKKGVLSKLAGGLGGLYNITGYMSDILSYSRILALSLATGVVGMVMNLLAGMVSGSVMGFVFSLLIYVVGHVFNLAMGLLSAYVHDSRLQYIEFFNKFYEGGGYAFRPLKIDPRYADVVDAGENQGGK